jgi:hypothetical protein
MHIRNSVRSTRLLFLAPGVLLGLAVNVKAADAPVTPLQNLNNFINCVSTTLLNKNKSGPVSIADTVPCLPSKCTLTITTSPNSDQRACPLYAGPGFTIPVQFPRYVFKCPGPTQGLFLRPSYSLCPTTYTNLEVAQDTSPPPTMLMSAMQIGTTTAPSVPQMKFQNIIDNTTLNQPTGFVDEKGVDQGTKSCNSCHFPVTIGQNKNGTQNGFLLSQPIDIFGKASKYRKGTVDMTPFVLYTTEPGQKATAADPMTPAQVCTAITDNQNKLFEYNAQSLTKEMYTVILALCNNLAAYKP